MFPPCFPPTVLQLGLPFPPPGSRDASSPASAVLREAPTSQRPSRRTSFPSLGGTCWYACVRSVPPGVGSPAWSFGIGSPTPTFSRRRWDLPGSWRTLMCLCPGLRPRQDLPPKPFRGSGAAHACNTTKAPTSKTSFEARSRGFGTGCLRFAPPVTRAGRKTRFRLLARLYREGLVTLRVRTVGFRKCVLHLRPPPPSLPGASHILSHLTSFPPAAGADSPRAPLPDILRSPKRKRSFQFLEANLQSNRTRFVQPTGPCNFPE